MTITLLEMEGNEGFTITHSSSVLEKIDVVQQVATILEDTYRAAKDVHSKSKEGKRAKILSLQQEIQRLENEIDNEEEYLANVTASLEDDTQKYLGLENKLLTIEERGEDDFETLPELDARTDVCVAKYLTTERYSEWQQLKARCQYFNQCTESSLRDTFCFRRFQVSATPTFEDQQRFQLAAQRANFLNAFRGKKCITGSQQLNPSRSVCVTWYKNDKLATSYVEMNVYNVIEQVCYGHYDDYRGRELNIVEADSENGSTSNYNELTIHVQPDSSNPRKPSAHNMTRRITLFQFSPMAVNPGPGTSSAVEYAPTTRTLVVDRIASPATPARPTEVIDLTTPPKNVSPRKYVPKPKSRKTQEELLLQSPIRDADVLSLVGFGDPDPTSLSQVATRPGTPHYPEPSSLNPASGRSPYKVQPSALGSQNETGSSQREFNGIFISDDTLKFVQLQNIMNLSEIQKRVIQLLKERGDMDYKGVENCGKTLATLIGIHDAIQVNKKCVQAMIITHSSESVDWILGRLELSDVVECCGISQVLEWKNTKVQVQASITSQILVGTLKEAADFALHSPDKHKCTLRFLVLHKCDSPSTDKASTNLHANENFNSLNKILYALDANIKVMAIRRSDLIYPGMDAFCSKRLRFSHILLEDNENPWPHSVRRSISKARSISDASNHPSVKTPKKVQTQSATVPPTIVPQATNSQSKQRVRRTRSMMPRPSSSSTDDTSSVMSVASDKSEYKKVEPMYKNQTKTMITREGMLLLGICRNAGKAVHDEREEEEVDETVSHMYAMLEEDENFKIDCISLLNIDSGDDRCVIFCDNVEEAETLCVRLRQKQLWPQVVHEDITSKDQKMIFDNFEQGHVKLLVCTDFVSSISLSSANLVMNYTLPKTAAYYMSRSAFAVRHSSKDTSMVVSLISNKGNELKEIKRIADEIGVKLTDCHE